ncbi:xanthine dehydrogenase family protein subunit M [Candidatus Poribacteria bacterium]|nr:xanthine dehydrogenase family protein subunit M [Candidatus Poribacteria bacterium]MYB64841.1 xanthine dehydrogenase family protein subunit M [Candidatus Poribacteria bacterium]
MQAFEYIAANTVSEVVTLLDEKGENARILAGGTDLIVQVREGKRNLDWMIDIKSIPEVNEIDYNADSGLTLGAAVPCYQIYAVEDICDAYPGLIDATTIIGGTAIQGRAAIGGNLCNASPAADAIPPLIVLKATCVIAGPNGEREIPVEDFCTAPGQTVLEKGEMLVSIKIPAPQENSSSYYLRFIPRNEMDIAVVGAGASVVLDAAKERFISARIALAAVAPTPLFAEEASTLLAGREISDSVIDEAAQAAQSISRPISDMRGTAEQRTHLVGVLTRRALNGAIQRVKEAV